MNEHYGLEDEDISHPTNHKTIEEYQQKDKEFIKSNRITKFFSENSNIVIPKQLEIQVIE